MLKPKEYAFGGVCVLALCGSMYWFLDLRQFTAPLIAGLRFSEDGGPDECPVVRNKRSHWYGASAYPVATEEEAWSWILFFLVFPDLDVGSAENFTGKVVTTIASSTPMSKVATQIGFFRFAGAANTAIFDSVAVGIAENVARFQLDQVDLPRQFCNKTACRSMSVLPRMISQNVIFINAMINDVYDISQMIACAAQAEYLVLAITTEGGPTDSERYAYALHDLLNALYFEYDWIPFATESAQCKTQRYSCTLWTAWRKFRRGDGFTYFPPAAGGSVYDEIKRLGSYLGNPKEGMCHRRELIGALYNNDIYAPQHDGQYAVCMDRLKHRDPSSCLVYSCGVGGTWSFEDTMHRLGCSVFSFDPSLNLADHKRGDNHYFFSKGLVSNYSSVPSNWNITTMKNLYEDLGHKGRQISMLKMDCETPELTFIDSPDFDEMAPFIQQFALEVHYFPGGAEFPVDMVWSVARILHKLEKFGFELYYSRPGRNVPGHLDLRSYDGVVANFTGSQTIVFELAYVNKNKF